jgi:hypothetical protein
MNKLPENTNKLREVKAETYHNDTAKLVKVLGIQVDRTVSQVGNFAFQETTHKLIGNGAEIVWVRNEKHPEDAAEIPIMAAPIIIGRSVSKYPNSIIGSNVKSTKRATG